MRRISITTVITVGLLLAGCGGGAEDRVGIAAAKRAAPVQETLNPSDPLQVQIQPMDTEVSDLGQGRFRVTGSASVLNRRSYSFTCVVVPDASDKLRGFRVTELQVER